MLNWLRALPVLCLLSISARAENSGVRLCVYEDEKIEQATCHSRQTYEACRSAVTQHGEQVCGFVANYGCLPTAEYLCFQSVVPGDGKGGYDDSNMLEMFVPPDNESESAEEESFTMTFRNHLRMSGTSLTIEFHTHSNYTYFGKLVGLFNNRFRFGDDAGGFEDIGLMYGGCAAGDLSDEAISDAQAYLGWMDENFKLPEGRRHTIHVDGNQSLVINAINKGMATRRSFNFTGTGVSDDLQLCGVNFVTNDAVWLSNRFADLKNPSMGGFDFTCRDPANGACRKGRASWTNELPPIGNLPPYTFNEPAKCPALPKQKEPENPNVIPRIDQRHGPQGEPLPQIDVELTARLSLSQSSLSQGFRLSRRVGALSLNIPMGFQYETANVGSKLVLSPNGTLTDGNYQLVIDSAHLITDDGKRINTDFDLKPGGKPEVVKFRILAGVMTYSEWH